MPTPLNKYREQDLSFVISAAETIPTNARRPVIILESTTYPGTAVEVLAPLFEKRNLSVGRDIVLAFSPESDARLIVDTQCVHATHSEER